jgi:hypothetical protein
MVTYSALRRVRTEILAALTFLARAAIGLRQFLCGLHGHDSLLHFEKGRMSLLCASCGHQSPGWEVGPGSAHPVGGAKPHIVRMPVAQRRAA